MTVILTKAFEKKTKFFLHTTFKPEFRAQATNIIKIYGG